MENLLHKLANKLGVNTSFTYCCNGFVTCEVKDEVLRFFIESLGYNAKNDDEIMKSLDRFEKTRYQKALETIYVMQINNKKFDVVLADDEFDYQVMYSVEGQNNFQPLNVDFVELERRENRAKTYIKFEARIIDDLAPNYYDIKVITSKGEYKTIIAVAPNKCHNLDTKGKDKLFGFALQLYSLRSEYNWGVGDFTDLSKVVETLANSGGDVIGLNPLNVLLHDYPEFASPYASTSRLFINPIYIDVTNTPFYQDTDKDNMAIYYAKEKDIIDYTAVYNAKIKALKNIFVRVLENQDNQYAKDFRDFIAKDTGELHRLAVFQTLTTAKVNAQDDKERKKYQDAIDASIGPKVDKFVKENAEKIDFFKFLQFEADRQLGLVYDMIKERNMAVGLYRDLPVGVSKDSAEVWNDKYLYMQGSGAGAPPDSCFPTGQKWCLGAFNPFELRERAYKPLIRIMRANMKYAGAIRIDHVMGLLRLYLIADSLDEGTYLSYRVEDMFNIVALESYLNECVVVGECIGNVPEGFREMLEDRRIYSLGVLMTERYDDGAIFRRPNDYNPIFFASVATHDMPPIKAWWNAVEITEMKNLGLFSEEEAMNAYKHRDYERKLLLEALDKEGVWPYDRPRQSDYLYGDGFPEGLEDAVHAYMSKTNSVVFMLQLEDIYLSEKLQNLPGTDVDKHPNWRRKISENVENIATSWQYQRSIDMVKKFR